MREARQWPARIVCLRRKRGLLQLLLLPTTTTYSYSYSYSYYLQPTNGAFWLVSWHFPENEEWAAEAQAIEPQLEQVVGAACGQHTNRNVAHDKTLKLVPLIRPLEGEDVLQAVVWCSVV